VHMGPAISAPVAFAAIVIAEVVVVVSVVKVACAAWRFWDDDRDTRHIA